MLEACQDFEIDGCRVKNPATQPNANGETND